jgi:uncharacterized OsmC-like protein
VEDLREIQRPLKDRYRSEPASSRITLRASGTQQEGPMACSVEVGRAIARAEAHPGVGGAGTSACSGDLLLGALAACAQITCQMVAAAIGVPVRSVETVVEGDLDLAGTLGLSKEVPVGFEAIRMRFELDAPEADAEQLAALRKLTERYCVVMQTLARPPAVTSDWSGGGAAALP